MVQYGGSYQQGASQMHTTGTWQKTEKQNEIEIWAIGTPNLVTITLTRRWALTMARLCEQEAKRVSRSRTKRPWNESMGARDLALERELKLRELVTVFDAAGATEKSDCP
jgi:hypothetical protein